MKRDEIPVALTIAGSDSGGGAGIQADLKTFAALGVHGASAIACLTAQNPRRVLAVEPCPPKILRRQIEAVFEELPPAAVKTGMLFSAENVRVVADFFRARAARPRIPLVVDPVMVSTSGATLLKPAAIKVLKERLLPLATLVTPNLHEAEILTGCRLASVEDLRAAARDIHARLGCAALVKGGHLKCGDMSPQSADGASGISSKRGHVRALPRRRQATDIFFDGQTELLLTAPFVRGIPTHGTGCVFSAAVCAALALGNGLPRAVQIAKRLVTRAISGSYRVGRHFALNPSPERGRSARGDKHLEKTG
ncbi:MAG: bifunctional hydroxymethylpyrimidine kinase/phosphomethylpyrimidine kinase [Verrucomicrobiota bacterium]|nr:bifunctional hydroxymethylpyrimidine kinase/phosphomethylpyrimidine kinase [Verrucomicrobiota bacterium]